jgi:hypothetical protein
VEGDRLDLPADPHLRAVEELPARGAGYVQTVYFHIELLQDDVLVGLDEEQLREERIESVLVVETGHIDLAGLRGRDVPEVHRLVEHAVGEVGIAFLEVGTVSFDHQIRRVIEYLVPLHGSPYRSGGFSFVVSKFVKYMVEF